MVFSKAYARQTDGRFMRSRPVACYFLSSLNAVEVDRIFPNLFTGGIFANLCSELNSVIGGLDVLSIITLPELFHEHRSEV